ncbi:hypothetical protein FRC11_001092, partial [Ceratobasidium sp. 423]
MTTHDHRVPLPDFDAGLNSSTAWRKHLSISDAPQPPSPVQEGKPVLARAIRDVPGNEDNRELGLKAGENIEILNSSIGEEWTLAKKLDGDMGLVPNGCYVTIQDFPTSSPPISPTGTTLDGPIKMQSTGESIIASSLYTIRQSVLGGKSLNRFSHFVVTGAEEWIINGYDPPASRSHERFRTDVTVDGTEEEVGRHYVE